MGKDPGICRLLPVPLRRVGRGCRGSPSKPVGRNQQAESRAHWGDANADFTIQNSELPRATLRHQTADLAAHD